MPDLEPSFVLYPAGNDGQDNVEALIVAFARLPEALRSSRQLVLSGYFPETTASQFTNLAAAEGIGGRVLCTGVVPKESMPRLYQAAELVCFPSLLHGYGLPVAEAMACGAVVIVSDVDPSRDLVAPEARFDPSSPAAISASIERGLCDETFRETCASARLGVPDDMGRRCEPDRRRLRSTVGPARPAMAPSSSSRGSLAVSACGFWDRELQLPPRRRTGRSR